MTKMRPTFTATHYGSPVILSLRTSRYHYGGNLAVQFTLCDKQGREQEPFGTLSINVDDVLLDDGEFIATHDFDKAFLADLEAQGLVERTGRLVDYGYVTGRPICRLTAKAYELDRTRTEGD